MTLGDQVTFVDDAIFGAGGTNVFVKGDGTVVYNGTTDYQGGIIINNANFKVNGVINEAPVFVCRNIGFSQQRGTLSGIGTLTGDVLANSGSISPDTGKTLTLGSLTLNPADLINGTLGSLVHIAIDSNSTPSVVSVTGPATLAGTLEIDLDPNAKTGSYKILTSSAITGTFDSVSFTGPTPSYSLSYVLNANPQYVQFNLGDPPSTTTVVTYPNPTRFNHPFIIKATVTSSSTPTGKVVFKVGNRVLGIAMLIDGIAKIKTCSLPRGTSTIRAIYLGNRDFAPSSGTTTHIVR